MSFISYAQHGEDVMLMRALKHVEHGFYIDVGANHPSEDSVTKAFYDLGWYGLNIEPRDEHIAQLRAERLRDINLQLAVGASVGEITLYNTEVRGLATASAEVAERHASQGLATHASVVPMRPLSDICAEYAAGREIHFLKIDVEGHELAVIAGAIQAGIIFLPLNTAYTAAEVGYFVENSGARLLLCDPKSEAALSPVAPRVLTLAPGYRAASRFRPAPMARSVRSVRSVRSLPPPRVQREDDPGADPTPRHSRRGVRAAMRRRG